MTTEARRTSSSTSATATAIAFFDLPGLDLGPYAEVLGGLHHLAISVEPGDKSRPTVAVAFSEGRPARVEICRLEPRGLTAGFGGGIALTDCVIYYQDKRRSLRLPGSLRVDRLQQALSLAMTAPTLFGRRSSRGWSIVPTDFD